LSHSLDDMDISETERVELLDDVGVDSDGITVRAGTIDWTQWRQADTDAFATTTGSRHRFCHFEQKTCTVFARSAVSIRSLIRAVLG